MKLLLFMWHRMVAEGIKTQKYEFIFSFIDLFCNPFNPEQFFRVFCRYVKQCLRG